jgi:RNA polymerase sigma-70 factor (ECF subfamily)
MVLQECQSLSDAEAVDRVRGGETDLFELLMRRHNQRLFRIIRAVVINDLEAEDVLQEAWVRAYEHLDQFSGRASFPAWVTSIAYNEALARSRKSKRRTLLEDAEGEIMPEASRCAATSETPETQAIRGEFAQLVQSAVDALSETYRLVFVLREVEQLSTNETAECLGISEEAVKTRLHRSRALLRRELQAQIGPTIAQAYSFLGIRCDRTVARVLDRLGAGRARPSVN